MKLVGFILCLCLYNVISQEWEEFPLPNEEFPVSEQPEWEYEIPECPEYPGEYEGGEGEGEIELPTEWEWTEGGEGEGEGEGEWPITEEGGPEESGVEEGGSEEEEDGIEEGLPTETEVEGEVEELLPTDTEGPLYPIGGEEFSGYLGSRNFLELDVQDVLNFAVEQVVANAYDLPAGNYQAYELQYGFRSYEGEGDIYYWDMLFEFSNCEGLSVKVWADLRLNPYTGVVSTINTINHQVLFLNHGPIPDTCPPIADPSYTNLINIVDTDTELQELIEFGVQTIESWEANCISLISRKIYAANSRVIDGQTYYQFNVGHISIGSIIARTAFDVTYNSENEREVTFYSYRLIFDDVSGHSSYEDDPTCAI